MPTQVQLSGNLSFDVSPDFIITTDDDGNRNSRLVLWKADGTVQRVPVPGLYAVVRPSLSPDGKRVAVQATETPLTPTSTRPFYRVASMETVTQGVSLPQM